METIDFIKELFEYNLYCNKELLKMFNDHPSKTSEKSIQLINHILNAQQIWNGRILKTKTNCEIWQIRPLHQLHDINETNHNQSIAILDTSGLDTIIGYINSKGINYSNSIKDILFHVINHSTYHRAQIASDMKQNGIEPINTDYIFYKRK